MSYFNSRAREGATLAFPQDSSHARISIHAPVRARRECRDDESNADEISIHAPVRARHGAEIADPKAGLNFNSRAREGATHGTEPEFVRIKISIHAPVRARHGGVRQLNFFEKISIHAPVRARRLLVV